MMHSEEMQAAQAVLQQGAVEVKGRFMWGSNYTFLVEVHQDKQVLQAVYKPTRGERPLWDFPEASLAPREAGAYLISQALGWDLVPPTVFRTDAPLGPGSIQYFIDHDPEYHYFNFSDEDRQRLRPVALFDLLVNNADRKGSHILVDQHNHLWLIDHGLCFHAEKKLRTVIWDFVGEAFPPALAAGLAALTEKLAPGADLSKALAALLALEEVEALRTRTARLLRRGRFPKPPPHHRPYPWPPV